MKQYETDVLISQPSAFVLVSGSKIFTVDPDSATTGEIESRQEREQGRFTGPRDTHDSD